VTPSGNDAVTIPCPVCATPFVPTGKRRYCRDACRVAAHRRRQRPDPATATVVPAGRPRGKSTLYECDNCATRAVGTQRCEDYGTFMRRVGPGGLCPCCDEPITIDELLGR
jgi:predicted nucleic acid-binding Zn ribbon protein